MDSFWRKGRAHCVDEVSILPLVQCFLVQAQAVLGKILSSDISKTGQMSRLYAPVLLSYFSSGPRSQAFIT